MMLARIGTSQLSSNNHHQTAVIFDATGTSSIQPAPNLPGLEGLFRYDYDSNKYLEDDNWATFSVGLTQSLVKLFTLPVRLEQADARQRLVDLRRQATITAVMAQVYIAHHNYKLAQETYEVNKRLLQVHQRMLQETKPENVS
ncbi:MAG: TolC family protein [Burkholderiaceae bacterium]|nr:TolC family protein [Burkholderiaceae bacterium]